MHIFPAKNCILCGVTSHEDLCPPCSGDLPRLPEPHCQVCLWPVAESGICGACLSSPPAFTRSIAAVRYAFPVDALIQSLKYRANLTLAPVLARLLLARIETLSCKPDLLIPMPLHPLRLRERGFNQAMEIARWIAGRMNLTLLPDACRRIKHTQPQMELPWQQRRKNIRKAFECSMDLRGKHIAVVDDVMTTGATLNELATTLRKQGATEISNWVIARTLLEKNQIDPFSIA